jgi:cytochrome c5
MTAKQLFVTIALTGVTCVASGRTGIAQKGGGDGKYQPFPTIWSGVYTQAEADRGKQTSARLCSRCHGTDLKGKSTAPGLTGAKFFDRWNDLRLVDVIAYIQGAMPREHEFFVSADATREIVGFMLQQSGIPPGTEPISRDVKVLNEILITRPSAK